MVRGPVARQRLGACAGLAVLAACSPADVQLVALPGCGRDVELAHIRVTVRGDFPQEPVRMEGSETLPALPEQATGITVEGLVDETRPDAVGRTARLRIQGRLPVYFAPPESLCAVPAQLGPRLGGAAAVGPEGDVLLVGGKEADGALSGSIVYVRDEVNEPHALPFSLPVPSTAQTVHALSQRRFLVVGGASRDGALSSMVMLDLANTEQPVSDPILLHVAGRARARAHHAGATLSDGSVLIVGGCTETVRETGACRSEPGTVQDTVFSIDAAGDPLQVRKEPSIAVARRDAQLLIARDGAVVLVGGYDDAGMPVFRVERWMPGATRWTPGVDFTGAAEGAAIVGASLIEGGMVVVALADGRLLWNDAGGIRQARPPMWNDPAPDRSLWTLPGERILADTTVLPVALLGADFSDSAGVQRQPWQVIDLTEITPGPVRVGASAVPLADGSVLLMGGRDPDTGAPGAGPLVLRYRPPLDGPDEDAPPIADVAPGSFVLHDGTIGVDRVTGGLRLQPRPSISSGAIPASRAHARGFRSHRFRFDVTFETTEDAVPHVVLEHGALEAWSIAFTASGIRAVHRTAEQTVPLSCSGDPIDPADGVRMEVGPERIELAALGGEGKVACEGLGGIPVAVGVGASGWGSVIARDLRLSR